ncbi:endonuclease MutS2 [Thermogemmatispora onikobensis]|uniref:endonuclease MutS2 n=1 Tax=Thermogemmatispora onikobensis TaxID=732234 RepID=UPI000852CCE0|nr:endonuclease MutS2 [Thermogemmatispora onikobensis]
MHEKSIQTLEYPKILERVAREASFSASKELVLALQPATSLEEVRERQVYTSEAVRLLDVQANASVGPARDIRPLVARAAREGVLTPHELLEVLNTLRSAAQVARLLEKLDPEEFPLLRSLGEAIPERPHLMRRIEETVNEDGEILDSASPLLRRLRFDIRSATQRLQERLRTIVNELAPALQEPIITIRNERYVVPVKVENRNLVRGIVHDQSSSGATLFIEPLVIVEMNNHLRQLQIEERQEIERILRTLSHEIGREAEALTEMVERLAEFDLHLAKARYSRLLRCSEPRLNNEGRIELRGARHPLLSGRVVPIDFRIGRDFFMVVITGPNTGGKTVALKTVGLLTLMAQAGLHIPAEDGSEIAVFEEVFADIGDEQSIEQNLSTFSSHLSRIIEIVRQIENWQERNRPAIGGEQVPPILVLLDEVGAGTDPSEGSALARAILSFLLERRITTVATTHYTELKAFAHEQPGAVNASVEFDIETLSPTYHLSIGLPGRSNALAIASRLGLDERIIERAREFLGSAGVRMETLLEGLQHERKAVADERFRLSMERAEAEHQRRQLEEERHRLERERVRILNEARARARREIEEVQAQLARIKLDVHRVNLTRERLDQARRQVRQLDERLELLPEPAQSQPQEEREELSEGPLQVGDLVRVLNFGQNAELVSLAPERGEAEVQMGALRFRVPLENLRRLGGRQAAEQQSRRQAPAVVLPRAEDRPEVSMQLDIRGWRVEEALEQLESYLNDAALAGLATVRVVHGKGTGALRSAVREHLARHPLVKSYQPAPAREGGDGVTIVSLSA